MNKVEKKMPLNDYNGIVGKGEVRSEFWPTHLLTNHGEYYFIDEQGEPLKPLNCVYSNAKLEPIHFCYLIYEKVNGEVKETMMFISAREIKQIEKEINEKYDLIFIPKCDDIPNNMYIQKEALKSFEYQPEPLIKHPYYNFVDRTNHPHLDTQHKYSKNKKKTNPVSHTLPKATKETDNE